MEEKRRALKKIEQYMGAKLLSVTKQAQEMTLSVDRQDIVFAGRYLRESWQARLFTMVGVDERPCNGNFALYYVFVLDQFKHFITVKILLPEDDPTFPSLTPYLPSLDWYEREVNDLLGLRAQGHPDRLPLVFHDDVPAHFYPLRKDFCYTGMREAQAEQENFTEYPGEAVTEIPVGPIHAGIIEPGHFRFGAVGDTVIHLDARLFYTHRGIEKSLEGKTIAQAVFLIERVCCVCNVSHSVSFSQAVERLAGVNIPVRAAYIRTLYMELERLYNHVGDVGNVCGGYGFAFGASQGARMREGLLQLNERLSGHRYLRGMIVPGGVKRDIDKEDMEMIAKHLAELERDFQGLADILLDHEIAVDRMEGTGVLTRDQAMDLDVVGVAARASGRNVDCRRDLPYAVYDKLNFAVVVKQKGDVLARVKVKILEVFSGISLIRQILRAIPEGIVQKPITEIPSYTPGFGWSESARGENCHWLMLDEAHKIYRYRIRSAAYSNWPAVALSVPGNIIPDFPLINKSFELCYACCDR